VDHRRAWTRIGRNRRRWRADGRDRREPLARQHFAGSFAFDPPRDRLSFFQRRIDAEVGVRRIQPEGDLLAVTALDPEGGAGLAFVDGHEPLTGEEWLVDVDDDETPIVRPDGAQQFDGWLGALRARRTAARLRIEDNPIGADKVSRQRDHFDRAARRRPENRTARDVMHGTRRARGEALRQHPLGTGDDGQPEQRSGGSGGLDGGSDGRKGTRVGEVRLLR
jgi:hypothetical protein